MMVSEICKATTAAAIRPTASITACAASPSSPFAMASAPVLAAMTNSTSDAAPNRIALAL
jgi:hypothetical protein